MRKYSWRAYALVICFILAIFLIHCYKLQNEDFTEGKKQESLFPRNQGLVQETHTMIRVLIKTDGYAHITHPKVKVTAKDGLVVQNKKQKIIIEPGETFVCEPDDAMFKNGSIKISPCVSGQKIKLKHLTRGRGTPTYRGGIELFSTKEGIAIVNELSLEEYLYGVVPSEMPSSYHLEALKCQAVCARSYAICQMKNYAYPEFEAHVDDSTSFQVYGNSNESKTANRAINETRGETVQYKGKTVITYYFSTSSGCTTDIQAWGRKKEKKYGYLKGVKVCDEQGICYEETYPWHRWKITVTEQTLTDILELNLGMEIGELQKINVKKRGEGEIALVLYVKGSNGEITVETENKIRRALGSECYEIVKQDGSISQGKELLPSAFFDIKKEDGLYKILGGGFGHGIGMSQNGANEMAKSGKDYREIITFFYPKTKIGKTT